MRRDVLFFVRDELFRGAVSCLTFLDCAPKPRNELQIAARILSGMKKVRSRPHAARTVKV